MDEWIDAKCLSAMHQDSSNFWWAKTRHTYKFLDPLLLGTLLTIKPTFNYFYQPCVLSTLVCKSIYPHFIEVCNIYIFIANNQFDKFELLVTINVRSATPSEAHLQEDLHELWDLSA
jgi:hypothetical protein